MLNAHLDALRHAKGRLPGFVVKVASEQTVLRDLLAAFADPQLPLEKVFYVAWGPAGIRPPFLEIMDMFLMQLGRETGPGTLFEQRDGQWQLHRSCLPRAATWQQPFTAQRKTDFEACGRLLAKCVLEGIHIPINFGSSMHNFLLGRDSLSGTAHNPDSNSTSPHSSCSADEAIACLVGFDPEEAQRLRMTLAERHGNGDLLCMTLGMVLGTDDDTPLTDGNKEDIICRKVRAILVDSRREALQALRDGFQSLDLRDHLAHFSGQELGTLLCGEEYVDIARVVDALDIDTSEAELAGPQVTAWLRQFVQSLSEVSVRVFLARVTATVRPPQPHETIRVKVVLAPEQPEVWPASRRMQVPVCTSYEAFAARMAVALRLGEYGARTGAQQRQRISQAEQQAIAAAMQEAGNVRAGGWYRCTNGHVFCITECGGAMEEANCPECGARIGGTKHRLLEDNQHVPFDGAPEPAWPLGREQAAI